MSDVKKVIIMRSPSGGGKSTMARKIVEDAAQNSLSAIIHSTDDLFIKNGIYNFNSELIGPNHNRNFKNFQKSLDAGINVIIVDNTNIKRFEYRKYEKEAIEKGYSLEYSQFGKDFGFGENNEIISDDELVSRVSNRAKNDLSAATPPEEVIRRMYRDYKVI